MRLIAGIELGGTKIVCGLGTAGGELVDRARIDTRRPAETLDDVDAALRQFGDAHGAFSTIGIGTFGPVHLDPESPDYGHIGMTPKVPWRGFDLLGHFTDRWKMPVALDTDVTAAAFGEARWGAAVGAASVVYITVGTGIGAGVLIDGTPVHGFMHPEVGHVRLPRAPGDDYPGACPYHGDCAEGMAAGPSIMARWGAPLSDLPDDHPAYVQTAHYLAHLVTIVLLFYAPQKVVMGGGVMTNGRLFGPVRRGVRELLQGYLAVPRVEEHIDTLIVPPGLGNDAGILGCVAMAADLRS